MISRSSAALLA